ncbi:hypothetical protein [Streptomyces sp. NPDC002952]|uniref:hypothetical protein n=1 Tax=Streptomyces sp. NPDC002952 TaxID=3364673 RepID=UPI0036B41DEE
MTDIARRPKDETKPVHVDVDDLPTLAIGDIDRESVFQLRARGAAYAREYHRIHGGQTVLLKNLATVIWALRLKHDDPKGSTHEYRQEVAEMYRQANIPPDSLSGIQAAVRWHVGNLVRQELPEKEIKALGLLNTSPTERQQDRRAVNSALLTASKVSAEASAPVSKVVKNSKSKGKAGDEPPERVPEQGSAVKATADHLRLVTAARSLVEQLDVDVISTHMTSGQRERMDDELAIIQEAVAKLRRRTRKRRSDA